MKRVFALVCLVLPLFSFAHPGHGSHGGSGYTIIHYLTEPDHALIALLGLAVLGVAIYKAFSKKERKTSRNA